MQNNIYLIVSNQAHEHIRQKGSISNQKQSKQIWIWDIWLLTILAWDQHHWWLVYESKAVALLYKKLIKQTSRNRSTGNWRVDLSNQLKIVTWCSPTSMTRKKLMCNRIIHEIDSVHVNHRRAEYYRNHCRITSPRPRNLDYCGNCSGLDINRRKPTSNK